MARELAKNPTVRSWLAAAARTSWLHEAHQAAAGIAEAGMLLMWVQAGGKQCAAAVRPGTFMQLDTPKLGSAPTRRRPLAADPARRCWL